MLMHGIQSAIDELYERVLALEEGGGGGEGAVKGVKGAVETLYRKGNVNISLPNVANLGGGLTYDPDTKELKGTQVTSLPTASADLVGTILQYSGPETADFKPGRFYTCSEDTPGVYTWDETVVGEANPDPLSPDELASLLSLLGY